jgi:hypothetical protein
VKSPESSGQAEVVETLFFTGYAKLPSSITAEKLYEVIAVGVEVNPCDGTIIDADCTLATNVGKNFFRKLVIGYRLTDGIENLVERFEKRYYGSARKAIVTGLKIMYEKWLTYYENKSQVSCVNK